MVVLKKSLWSLATEDKASGLEVATSGILGVSVSPGRIHAHSPLWRWYGEEGRQSKVKLNPLFVGDLTRWQFLNWLSRRAGSILTRRPFYAEGDGRTRDGHVTAPVSSLHGLNQRPGP